MISYLRFQELRSGWNSGTFHTRRMMAGEERKASIDSNRGTGIRPGSPLLAATETPLSAASWTTAKMSCSDCVLLITKWRIALGECVFFNSAMQRKVSRSSADCAEISGGGLVAVVDGPPPRGTPASVWDSVTACL